MPARLLTRVFVCCDVVSCLVQASGSSLASSQDWVGSTAQVGIYVLIGGLVLQAVAFAVFLGILGRFWVVARREAFRARHVPEGWTRVVLAVGVSSVLIMVCPLFAFCWWDFVGGGDGCE
jgi:hypothetical protein